MTQQVSSLHTPGGREAPQDPHRAPLLLTGGPRSMSHSLHIRWRGEHQEAGELLGGKERMLGEVRESKKRKAPTGLHVPSTHPRPGERPAVTWGDHTNWGLEK